MRTFRFTEEDNKNISIARERSGITNDTELLRFLLRNFLSTDKTVVNTAASLLKPKVRKFDDEKIEYILSLEGFPKGSCPQHPDRTFYTCYCWTHRDELANWMKEQYE
jgi:hypothetical protein